MISVAMFIIGWVILFGLILFWEWGALVNEDFGDTLSEQVWKLMKTIPGSFALVSLWSWLTWHFFIEPRFFESLWLTTYQDDLIVVMVGLFAATFLRRT